MGFKLLVALISERMKPGINANVLKIPIKINVTDRLDEWDETMNLNDARLWFRYRSRMTVRIEADNSSTFRNNMDCRHFDTIKIDSQEHLKTCTGTAKKLYLVHHLLAGILMYFYYI